MTPTPNIPPTARHRPDARATADARQTELYLKRHFKSSRVVPRTRGVLGIRVGSYYEADIVAINAKLITEVEIKTTLKDLKADFHKPKHRELRALKEKTRPNQPYAHPLPNRFYFALPEEIVKPALTLLNQKGADYAGVLVVLKGGLIALSRKAPRLHGRLATRGQFAAFNRSMEAQYWGDRESALEWEHRQLKEVA